MEYARVAGLDVPETRVPRDEVEVERSGRELSFPIYVKPRAQMFGRGLGNGVRVDEPAALLHCWQAQRRRANYDAQVLARVPDLCSPMLQNSFSSTERIYTVDGFVDETGELYITLACVKLLQRPRGSGPGIVFEHAEIDPAVEYGLQLLFQKTGYYGVFDAEFMECGTRKFLIDINPRFYNHMAFEIDRGLHLPWLTYLASIRDRQALQAEIENAKCACVPHRAYVHRLPTSLLLMTQRLAGAISGEDQVRWRRRISELRGLAMDPARAVDDPAPAVLELAMEALAFVRHPRAYLHALWKAP
jgi:hypothetical protein